MKISVKDVNPCEKLLTIDIPEETIQAEFSAFYDAVAKRAKIPGFRPGHAPRNVIALHFKKDAHDEVLHQLLERGVRDAVREKELVLAGYPRIEDIQFDEKKLKFNARVELRPKIKIDKYTGIKLTRAVSPVEGKEVDEILKRYQEAYGKFEPVEQGEAAMGDYLIADYRLEIDGKEIEKRDGEWFQIREKDYLDGFSKQLIGAKSGEERQVTASFPADYSRKEIAGKTGIFILQVKELKRKKLPALDDEFAKEVGDYKAFEDLKKAVRGDLEAHKKADAEVEMENQLLEELINRAKFDIPNGILERRQKSLVEEELKTMKERGATEEQLAKQKSEIEKSARVRAEREIRISFLLGEIAEREKVTAVEADFEESFKRMAERMRRPVDEIKKYYHENHDRMDGLEMQIVSEKVIEWLKSKAEIAETVKSKKD